MKFKTAPLHSRTGSRRSSPNEGKRVNTASLLTFLFAPRPYTGLDDKRRHVWESAVLIENSRGPPENPTGRRERAIRDGIRKGWCRLEASEQVSSGEPWLTF
jgi:hypothetical protein